MTTGKTIALTRRTFVGKVMSLLLNMLSEKDTNNSYTNKARSIHKGILTPKKGVKYVTSSEP